MSEVVFRLNFTPDEYLPFYRGDLRWVVVRGEDGRRVRFPAEHLRGFVTDTGIQGRFAMRFNRENKFQGIRRVGRL